MRTPYSTELMHYGILGMKWGVRRYQNADGTLTEAGKKRYRVNEDGAVSDEKGKKRYDRDTKKQLKSDASRDKKKQKAISSGDVERILKMRKYMTTQEVQDAVNRVTNFEKLRANSPDKLQKAEDRAELEAKVKTLGTVATGIQNASSAYNNAAKIFNVLPFETKLPIVGEKVDKPDIRENVQALIEAGNFKALQTMASKGQLSLKEVQTANKMKAAMGLLMNNESTSGQTSPNSQAQQESAPQSRSEARQERRAERAEAREERRAERAEARAERKQAEEEYYAEQRQREEERVAARERRQAVREVEAEIQQYKRMIADRDADAARRAETAQGIREEIYSDMMKSGLWNDAEERERLLEAAGWI